MQSRQLLGQPNYRFYSSPKRLRFRASVTVIIVPAAFQAHYRCRMVTLQSVRGLGAILV